MRKSNMISSLIYLVVYLVFIVITIVGFHEFWIENTRHGNFVYTVFFYCFLETLVATLLIAENTGYLNKYIITQNLFVLLGSMLTAYIIFSVLIIYLGNSIYHHTPSFLYLSTIAITFVFASIITWFISRSFSDKMVDNHDRNGRIKKINLVSLFEKMKNNYSSVSNDYDKKSKEEIENQIEVIERKIKYSCTGNASFSLTELDENIAKGVKNIESLFKHENLNGAESAEKIILELKIIKENLSKRESLLKI